MERENEQTCHVQKCYVFSNVRAKTDATIDHKRNASVESARGFHFGVEQNIIRNVILYQGRLMNHVAAAQGT